MATIRAYTTIEQSRKLAEILPIESADMYYDRGGLPSLIDKYVTHENIKNDKYHHLIPCWSLAALIDILPDTITSDDGIAFKLNVKKNIVEYSNPSLYLIYKSVKADNPVDACVAMIEKLHELNLL